MDLLFEKVSKLMGWPRGPRTAATPRRRRWWNKLIFVSSMAYVVLLLATWLMTRYVGDRWWVATLVLFGPRWVPATPLALLLIVAAAFDRRSLWVLLPGLAIAVFGLLGFCIPWGAWTGGRSGGQTICILTCNIHRTRATTLPLAGLIARTRPDIVVLQEYSRSFNQAIFSDGSWNIKVVPRWDGGEFCLASRFPVSDATMMPDYHRAEFAVHLPGGTIRVFVVHLASPHYQLSDVVHGETGGPGEVEANSTTRLAEAKDLARMAGNAGDSVILAGDFNLPDDSPIYRQSFGAFHDAFAEGGFGFGFTYYHRQLPLTRIDHVMFGPGCRCLGCQVAEDIGSPHRPVIAQLQRTSPAAPASTGP